MSGDVYSMNAAHVHSGFSKKHAINRIASTRKQWKSNEQSLVPMSLLGAAQEVEVEVVTQAICMLQTLATKQDMEIDYCLLLTA